MAELVTGGVVTAETTKNTQGRKTTTYWLTK